MALLDLINGSGNTTSDKRLIGKILNESRDRVARFYYTVGKSTDAGLSINRHTVWEKNSQERVDRVIPIDMLNNEINVSMPGVKWTSEANGTNLEHGEMLSFNRDDFKRVMEQVNNRLDYSFSDNMAGAKAVKDNIGEYDITVNGETITLYRLVISKHNAVALFAIPNKVTA